MTPQGMDPSFLNNPMVVNALTNGSMQYMPNAQFMTPQAYGNFRTLPDMMYQQPVNQQAGFLKSSMLASGWGAAYGLGYNPAVNPALQRVEASRLSSDTMTSTLSAIGGTVADFALPGLAFKLGRGLKAIGGKGLLGMPLRFAGGMLGPAALIAQMAISNLVEGPQEKIANIRALQRISRGKIVTGGDIDSGMLTGFSTRAAKSLDDHLYRRSLYDGIYDADDYRRMMSEGVQAGLFDYTSSVDGYKKVLHNIRDNMATVMEVTGSDDFKDVMEQLKRLQDLGASQAQYKSILRSENMFARITGMSHGDLVSTYGAMGALEFNQRGLSQIQGSQVAMHNAALVTIGQRNGTLSNAYLAAHGGVSGMAQQMTGEDAQARAGYENVLLAALYDPYTGELRTDAQEYLNTMLKDKRNGFVNLAREAGKNMSILAQQGPEAVINFKSKLPDLNQKLAEQTGLDINEQNLRVAIAKGRNILGSDIDDRTAAIRGLVSMGFSEKDAQLKVDSYSEIQRHRNEEQQLDTLKKIAEYNKENNALSVWWRSMISPIKEWFVKNRDETGGLNARLDSAERDSVTASGRRKVQEVDSFASGLASSYEEGKSRADGTDNAGKAIPLNFSKNNLGAVGFFGDEIQKELDKYKYARYEMGGNSTEAIDCSGLVLNVWQQLMKSVNKAMGEEYYSKDFMKLYDGDTTASGLFSRLKAAKGKVTQWGMDTNLDSIATGSTLFIQNKKDHSRPDGVIHTAMLMQNKEGKRYVVDATSRDGKDIAVKYMTPEEFRAHYVGKKGYNIYSVDNAKLNERLGGGQSLKQVHANLKSGDVLAKDLSLARTADGQVRTAVDPTSAAAIYGGSDEYGSTVALLGDMFTARDNSISKIAQLSNRSFDENYADLYKNFGKQFGKVDKAASLRGLFSGLNFDKDKGLLLKDVKERAIAYMKNNKATAEEIKAFSASFDNTQELQDMLYGTALSTAGHDTKAWKAARDENTIMSTNVNEEANLVGEEITERILGISDIAFKGSTTAANEMRNKIRELQKKNPKVYNADTLLPTIMLLTARKAKMLAVTDKDREKAENFISKFTQMFPGFDQKKVQAFVSGDSREVLQEQVGISAADELLSISDKSSGVDFSSLIGSTTGLENTTPDKKGLGDLMSQLNTIQGLQYAFGEALQIKKRGEKGKEFYAVQVPKEWLQKQKFDEGSNAEASRQYLLSQIEKNKTDYVTLSGIDMKRFAEATKTSKNAVDANGNTVLNLENSNSIQANPGKSLGEVAENTKRTANYARDMLIIETNNSFSSDKRDMNAALKAEKKLDEEKAAAERTQGNNRV